MPTISSARDASPWTQYVDDATGAAYWHNEQTGESQWEKPDESLDAVPVESLDDLGV